MKTVAFIPIKLNNERLQGKNIKKFSDGTPLIYFIQKSLANLKKEGVIDQVFVYCSNPAISEYLIDDVAFMPRPQYLDHPTVVGRTIYKEFVNSVDADIYVLAHATSPFVKEEHIKECIQNVKSGIYDSAFCAKKLQTFLWQNNEPLNFNLSDPPKTQDISPIYMELSTAYVFTKENFMKHESRSGKKPFICECDEIESIDIDYQEDFDLADAVYMNVLKGKDKHG